MNRQQRHVYNVLSVVEYTAGRDFGPRIDPTIVPQDEHYKVLKELEAMGLAELAFGKGWRAIESEDSTISPDFQNRLREWRAEVTEKLTLLSFKEWIINKMLQREEQERQTRNE